MEVVDTLLGPPLPTKASKHEKIGVLKGVPVLGLDALASASYGPEAALAILLPVGAIGLHYVPWIAAAIVLLMIALYFSYRQTIEAYPNGGGAYIVASRNLGAQTGLIAAAALLLDYTLNVAVAISAGIAALVSAVPLLHSYTVALCLLVLAGITLVNLRGVRESGFVFAFPTYLFVVSLLLVLGFGVIQVLRAHGNPHPIIPPPPLSAPVAGVGVWLLLRSFASGCTAMTGVEAVSNGVPLFGEPTVKRAQGTLTVIVTILGLLLCGIAYLANHYHVGAMDQQKEGYQSVISQLVGAIVGRGFIYYVTLAGVLGVLTLSANTSFADFPRLCRLLAEDEYLPGPFANLGRRLVYSIGITILAIFSAVILIVFGGITDKLIPLFAVGAFSAFTLSQAGMIVHWQRSPAGKHRRTKMLINILGASGTAAALLIIIVTKFAEGAWATLLLIPLMLFLFHVVKRHYKGIAREINRPIQIQLRKVQPITAVVPIDGWNLVAERAFRFALRFTPEIIALHVTSQQDNKALRKKWAECVEKPLSALGSKIPHLQIVHSPFRQLYQPILDFVAQVKQERPEHLIAIIIPELVQPRWWEYFLHNQRAAGLKALLYLNGDERTIVINVPWYLRRSRK